jgi:hypothetical protein
MALCHRIIHLLSRRGFVISEQSPDYVLKILYKTSYVDKETSIQSNQYGTWLNSMDMTTGYSGYGVMFASSLVALTAGSSSMSSMITHKYEMFNHHFSCEIYMNQKDPVWKFDTNVESTEIDILNHTRSFLQIAFAGLPSSEEVIPFVPKVRANKISDFINQFLSNRSFICPALPSYITFRQSQTNRHDMDIIGVMNPEAMMAFMDLLQTAEYAIPDGSVKDWNDPTQKDLWKRATLIGKYRIGRNMESVNVVVHLSGTPAGYQVMECKLVNDEAFKAYQSSYDAWKKALYRYYQFFE